MLCCVVLRCVVLRVLLCCVALWLLCCIGQANGYREEGIPASAGGKRISLRHKFVAPKIINFEVISAILPRTQLGRNIQYVPILVQQIERYIRLVGVKRIQIHTPFAQAKLGKKNDN